MIHENETSEVDFSWLYFIGHCLLGYTDHEVGRMTFKRLMQMYKHYKNNYDFKLSGRSYAEVDDYIAHDGEFLPD